MPENLIFQKQEQTRTEKINALQQETFSVQFILDDIMASNQNNIRFSSLTSPQQAALYVEDLGLTDLKDISDPQAKAFHLYGFYDYLSQQHQIDDYDNNLLKLFQLAVFYDDNYVYRYLLAQAFHKIGMDQEALNHINNALLKIKNNNVRLYPELEKSLKPALVQSQIARLAKLLLSEQSSSQKEENLDK